MRITRKRFEKAYLILRQLRIRQKNRLSKQSIFDHLIKFEAYDLAGLFKICQTL